MSKYEGSIKCKYCSHFEPGANRCHLYYNFDQSLDKTCSGYLKETSPNDVCDRFALTAMDAAARSVSNRRRDGSYIVTLENDPELAARLKKGEQQMSMLDWIACGLGLGLLLGLLFNSFMQNWQIIPTMMFWCAVITGGVGYHKR